MGLLINGIWHDQWYDTDSNQGRFVRQQSSFRHQIDGEQFTAEFDRYQLFVSLACPWAHRTLIFRQLKQLQDIIDVTVVEPLMLEQGWRFAEPGEPLYGLNYLHQLYTRDTADYTGRVTVPVLWDKKTQAIVNNESADIIRIFNSAFNHLTGNQDDYYPEPLRAEIDSLNTLIYEKLNNGVYRAGFATSQSAYEEAYADVFDCLDILDYRLGQHPYLLGDAITEADWRLFTTLIRFDAVYYSHFKTNRQRISDFAFLPHYLYDLYSQPGIAQTVNMQHIKQHYFGSHRQINPTGIIPQGPKLAFEQ